MTIVVTSIALCSGGNHVFVSGTVNGNATTVKFLRSEFSIDLTDPDEVRTAIIGRWRSAAKEAGATTNAQINAAIVGKSFQV